MDDATTAPVFLGDLTYGSANNGGGCLGPIRKRARAGHGDVPGAGLVTDLQEAQQQRALLPPLPQALAPSAAADVLRSRLLCSAAASTSGRPAPAPHSHPPFYRHAVEVDALLRIESERLRAALQEARRRHVGAVVSALERAAARRLRAAEAELGRALARNAELGERLREAADEGRAWQDAAKAHEGVAAGLRATLDDLLHQPPPPPEGDAESCCFEAPGPDARCGTTRACRACGAADACVLMLPCRHLCLCRACEAGVEACPVCFAARNASLHVLLP